MTTPMSSMDVTQDDKLWAALGYPIVIVALIVLFMDEKKNRPFIKYHAIQSIIFNLVLWVAYFILSAVSFGLLSLCFPLVWLITFWPAYKAYQGEWMELPVITNFMRNQGWV